MWQQLRHVCFGMLIHTSRNSSLWATASRHSWPVLSTERVNSTNSPLSSWMRVTRQLLLETVYLRVLLSFRPNGKGMFKILVQAGPSFKSPEIGYLSSCPFTEWLDVRPSTIQEHAYLLEKTEITLWQTKPDANFWQPSSSYRDDKCLIVDGRGLQPILCCVQAIYCLITTTAQSSQLYKTTLA